MYNISNISTKYRIYPIYPIYWRVTIKKIVFPRIKSNCCWSLLFTTMPRGVGVFFNCFQPSYQKYNKLIATYMKIYTNIYIYIYIYIYILVYKIPSGGGAALPGPAPRRPGRPLARASGPGRATRPRRRLVFCIYLVYICIYLYMFVYLLMYFCICLICLLHLCYIFCILYI